VPDPDLATGDSLKFTDATPLLNSLPAQRCCAAITSDRGTFGAVTTLSPAILEKLGLVQTPIEGNALGPASAFLTGE